MTVQLATGEREALGSFPVKPTPREALPGRQLPAAGNCTMTAVWLEPIDRKSVVFVLFEGPGPAPTVGLTALPVGFPDDGDTAKFEVGVLSGQARPPCVSRSAFFIDHVGPAPRGPALLWYREGELETSFRVSPRRHTLRLRPIMSFRPNRLGLSRKRALEYFLILETSGVTRDFLLIALREAPDHTFGAEAFPASQGIFTWGRFRQADVWEWKFYALDDSPAWRSPCRARHDPQ